MRAMILTKTAPIVGGRDCLESVELPTPNAGPEEVRLKVLACGVCHTELDEIEGRLTPPHLPIVPGHEVVGRIDQVGEGVTLHQLGDRVGVGWVHSSSGERDENVSHAFRATGKDANGGYAQFMTVRQQYAYKIPDVFSDAEAAPLLCAGAIGYRALRLADLSDGEPLGLMGFGGSAHLVLQLTQHLYPRSALYVFARDREVRDFAVKMGATWAGDTTDRAPVALRSIIDTTPAWKPVVESLANLRPGGRLVINAIRKEDQDKDYLQHLSYHDHLWLEREIKSVANITHFDIAEFLPIAAEIPIRPTVKTYTLEQANQALRELRSGQVQGAKVLLIGDDSPTNRLF